MYNIRDEELETFNYINNRLKYWRYYVVVEKQISQQNDGSEDFYQIKYNFEARNENNSISIDAEIFLYKDNFEDFMGGKIYNNSTYEENSFYVYDDLNFYLSLLDEKPRVCMDINSNKPISFKDKIIELETSLIIEQFTFFGYKIYSNNADIDGVKLLRGISKNNDISVGIIEHTKMYYCINNKTQESFETKNYLKIINYIKSKHKTTLGWLLTGKS